jgi:transposase
MGRRQTYPVSLSAEDRADLEHVLHTGQHLARVRQRAQILLWSHEGKQDKEIASLLHCDLGTVANARRFWVTDRRLTDLPRRGGTPKLDAKQQARLVALACSDAPDGRAHWTMQLLADELVMLQVVDRVSDETVRRTLKKTHSNPGVSSSGVSPK